MTATQFKAMMAAAIDIVRQDDDQQGNRDALPLLALDKLTVQWARDLIAGNSKVRMHATPLMDKLNALYDSDPMVGLTVPEICRALERPTSTVCGMLYKLGKEGKSFGLIERGHSRYYATEAARQVAKPAFEAARQARAAKRRKKPKGPKIPTLKAMKPPQEPRMPSPKIPKPKVINLARREATPFNPTDELKVKPRSPVRSVFHSGDAFIPKHVKVQVIPTAPSRYAVTAPADGFLAEFKRLRGEA